MPAEPVPLRPARARRRVPVSVLVSASILFGPLALLALAVLSAALYQRWADVRDARRYPPPGVLVDVSSSLRHLNCTGAGAPTVVLDSWAGNNSVLWMRVMPLVAERGRVCAYDRAGLGWSEPASGLRTAGQMADELRALLLAAHEPGPYVLAGSGLGGYTVRLFASRYPRDVAGVVLMDTMSEEHVPQTGQNEALIRTVAWAGTLGIVRAKAELTGAGWSRVPPYPQSAWPLVSALNLRTSAFRAARDESLALDQSAAQVRAERAAFPPIPLVVITPGPPRGAGSAGSSAPAPPEGPSASAEDTIGTPQWRYWREQHARIVRTSPRGRHIIAAETNAPFALTHPGVVARAITEVVDEARRQ